MKKNTDYINHLLERFYQGQTSESEEQELKRYLLEEETDESLSADRKLFLELSSLKQELDSTGLPEGMQQRLSARIDQWDHADKIRRKRKLRLTGWWSGIAAILIVGISLSLFHQQPDTPMPPDTFDSPEVAYAETQKVLHLLADALEKGTSSLEKADKINRDLQNKINKISKIENYEPKNHE